MRFCIFVLAQFHRFLCDIIARELISSSRHVLFERWDIVVSFTVVPAIQVL